MRAGPVLAEIDLPAILLRGEQHTPAIFRHAHVIEFRPTLGVDAHGRAEINERFLKTFRTHVIPPVEITGVPAFKRLQDLAVACQVDVVRDFRRVVDVEQIHLALLSL